MKITEVYEELKTMTDDYYTVSYEMSRYSKSSEEIECGIYVKHIGHHKAQTFALALEKVKESMGKIKPDSLEVNDES